MVLLAETSAGDIEAGSPAECDYAVGGATPMKLFCDHDELLAELRAERDILRQEVAKLRESLTAAQTVAHDMLVKLAASKVPETQVITAEMMAKRLGIPESAIHQIDFQRLGLQLDEDTPMRH